MVPSDKTSQKASLFLSFFLLFTINSKISGVSFKLWLHGSPFTAYDPLNFWNVPIIWSISSKITLKYTWDFFLLFTINSRTSSSSFKLCNHGPPLSLYYSCPPNPLNPLLLMAPSGPYVFLGNPDLKYTLV